MLVNACSSCSVAVNPVIIRASALRLAGRLVKNVERSFMLPAR